MLIQHNLLKKDNLKSKADELDFDKLFELYIDKLKPVPTNLSKISNVVKIMMLNEDYNATIKNIKDTILGINNLPTNAALDVKTN